jgi:hypothetical protein
MILGHCLLRMCQAVIFLSLGLAFSFLRRFGWLVAALLFWAYLLLHEIWPVLRTVNVIALSEPAYERGRWLIPWKPLGVQLVLAAILMSVAYLLFLGAGDRLLRAWQRLQQYRLGRALLFGGGRPAGRGGRRPGLPVGPVGRSSSGGGTYAPEQSRSPMPCEEGTFWSTARSRTYAMGALAGVRLQSG